MVDLVNTHQCTDCQKSLQLLFLQQDAVLQTDAVKSKSVCLQKSSNSGKVIISEIHIQKQKSKNSGHNLSCFSTKSLILEQIKRADGLALILWLAFKVSHKTFVLQFGKKSHHHPHHHHHKALNASS